MPDIFDNYAHQRTDKTPIIYAYSDTNFPGCLKVGFTTRTIEQRMKEHYPTLTPFKPWKVELIEMGMKDDGSTFIDTEVHDVLKEKGIPSIIDPDDKETEWFECSVDDVKSAIVDVKTGKIHTQNRTETFSMRPEQELAVKQTMKYYEEESKESKMPPKYLWNAKMRFGKTFTSYQLAKAMNLKKILILTFKPAVEESWEKDLNSHVDFEGWQFYHKDSLFKPESLDQSKPIVCFGSFQDFLGTNQNGGIKAKNEWVHATHWDLVIFDEYHFGAWRENAKKLFEMDDEEKEFDIEKYAKEEAGNAYNESFLPITTSYYLFLSGTPFRALNSGEFTEDQIFNWTYGQEQEEKSKYGDDPKTNPYLSLPRMVLLTYQMPEEIRRIATNEEYNEFDLNLFFKAESKTGNIEDSQFIYKEYVQKWLDLMRGNYRVVDDLKLGMNRKPVMPYSDVRMLSLLNHTLWYLPSVASCFAMKNLIDEKQNVFYQDYKINVCAGSSAGIGLAAVEPVKRSMRNPLKSKTITLTCGKLTTGVTVKPWTAIFMLRNLSSPETYFQAAFRVQSPWTMKNDDGSIEILKKECYVFDFALDRALKQISDYSCKLDVKEPNPEKKVQEFINFLPVLAYDGSTMKEVDATEILDITTAGTSATLLARKWQSALLVNVDNATLERLLHNEKAMNALMNIEGFRSLNQDIQTIINKSNAVKKAKKEGGAKTQKEKRELTEAEKEYKSKRKQIQEKLIKFATRVPVFMYLTDYREFSLKDIITQLEPGLFKAVTGLYVKDFELLVSLGVFNDSIMNEAVYRFKRYEDSSLSYAGIDKHANDKKVGLFSTAISKEDYEAMSKQQKESMYKKNSISSTRDKTSKTKAIVKGKAISKTTKEIPSHSISQIPKNPNKKKSRFINHVGDKVRHVKFGEGFIREVIKRNDDERIVVEFEDGVKPFISPQIYELGFLSKEDSNA
ncbi:GIY-YIG nuclease family protein [Faecalitalea cylindroides]|uniref:GIY-YIG nuclease family protein n=1 Tax=Faecalitalea cylindroides TaxID=39483 RepID=UPI00195EE4C7|nr:GIY-YIG nuclease family protein [Faecalitalea cylindroides]MBM6810362.1 GIY-YIG nuclease family protein [Faecalitalea cylindroides]